MADFDVGQGQVWVGNANGARYVVLGVNQGIAALQPEGEPDRAIAVPTPLLTSNYRREVADGADADHGQDRRLGNPQPTEADRDFLILTERDLRDLAANISAATMTTLVIKYGFSVDSEGAEAIVQSQEDFFKQQEEWLRERFLGVGVDLDADAEKVLTPELRKIAVNALYAAREGNKVMDQAAILVAAAVLAADPHFRLTPADAKVLTGDLSDYDGDASKAMEGLLVLDQQMRDWLARLP